MKKSVAFLIGAAFSCTAAISQPVNLTMSGASPGGLWTLIGVGLDKVVKKINPDSNITYQTSAGGYANIALLEQGKVPLGLAHDAELKVALEGKPPYKEAVKNVRAVGYMYNWGAMHFFIRKEVADKYKIQSLEDIASAKAPLKIAVNRRGNIVGEVSIDMLSAAGVTPEALKDWGGELVFAGSKDQAGLVTDGRVDVIANAIFVGHSSFKQIDKESEVVLLTTSKATADKINKQYGTATFTIPENSYRHQAVGVNTIALGAMLITNTSMSNDMAYTLTKALIANIGEVQSVHPSMKALTPEILVDQNVIAFHPGAEKAYKEASLMK